jgi:hypothetical protein
VLSATLKNNKPNQTKPKTMFNQYLKTTFTTIKSSPRLVMTIIVLTLVFVSTVLIFKKDSPTSIQQNNIEGSNSKANQEDSKPVQNEKPNYTGFTKILGFELNLNTAEPMEYEELQYGGYRFKNTAHEIITEPFNHLYKGPSLVSTDAFSDTKLEPRGTILGKPFSLIGQYGSEGYGDKTRVIFLDGVNKDVKPVLLPSGLMRVKDQTEDKNINLYRYDYKIELEPKIRFTVAFLKPLNQITETDIKAIEAIKLLPNHTVETMDQELDQDGTGKLYGSPFGNLNREETSLEFKYKASPGYTFLDNPFLGSVSFNSRYYTNSKDFLKYGVVPVYATCNGIAKPHGESNSKHEIKIICDETFDRKGDKKYDLKNYANNSLIAFYDLEVVLACSQAELTHDQLRVRKGEIIGFHSLSGIKKEPVSLRSIRAGQYLDAPSFDAMFIKESEIQK